MSWLFAAIRLWAILVPQVLLGRVCGPTWWVVAAGLSVALAPSAAPAPVGPWMPGDLAVLAALEVVLGTGIGVLVSLPGHALVGAMAETRRALGVSDRGLDLLGASLALAASLGLGIHRPLLVALRDLSVIWPPGAPQLWSLPLDWPDVALAAHDMTLLGLALATPVLLGAAVADLMSRLLGRGGGAAGALSEAMGPWLRTSLAFLALAASWDAYPEAWARALG